MTKNRSRNYKRSSAQNPDDISEKAVSTSRVWDYILLNVVFDAICVFQLIFVRIMLRDFAGLYFFFGFIMVAFLLASIFDYFSTRFEIGVPLEDNA